MQDLNTDAVRKALKYAKIGLIEAAIACELDPDLNNLDMEKLVEEGYQHQLKSQQNA